MDRIFQRAEDKNVAAVVIYEKASESTYAYKDSACTTKFTTSELKNAFLKVLLLPSLLMVVMYSLLSMQSPLL